MIQASNYSRCAKYYMYQSEIYIGLQITLITNHEKTDLYIFDISTCELF